MSTISEPWQTLMKNAGLHSYGQLAERADLPKSTVYAAITGRRRNIQPATITGLAKALRVTEDVISQALGMGGLDGGVAPYEPPSEASLLSAREREAVDEIIRLLIKARQQPTTNVDAYRAQADARTYTAEAEAKLQAVLQGGYVPAARHHEPDPLEGLGEENQDWEEK